MVKEIEERLAASVYFDEVVSGIRYDYFDSYWPTRYAVGDRDKDGEIKFARKGVFDFKNGEKKSQDRLIGIVESRLDCLIPDLVKELVLVCIPSTDGSQTGFRYKRVCEILHEKTGVALPPTWLEFSYYGERTEIHAKNRRGDLSLLVPEPEFYKDRAVMLIDDVVTTGRTASVVRDKLESLGAKVVGLITLCRTVSDGDVIGEMAELSPDLRFWREEELKHQELFDFVKGGGFQMQVGKVEPWDEETVGICRFRNDNGKYLLAPFSRKIGYMDAASIVNDRYWLRVVKLPSGLCCVAHADEVKGEHEDVAYMYDRDWHDWEEVDLGILSGPADPEPVRQAALQPDNKNDDLPF